MINEQLGKQSVSQQDDRPEHHRTNSQGQAIYYGIEKPAT
jgi:hypothetical protein